MFIAQATLCILYPMLMNRKEMDGLLDKVKEHWLDDPNIKKIWIDDQSHLKSSFNEPTLCFGVVAKYATEEEIMAIGSKLIPPTISGLRTEVYRVE